jgi:histone H3/H4
MLPSLFADIPAVRMVWKKTLRPQRKTATVRSSSSSGSSGFLTGQVQAQEFPLEDAGGSRPRDVGGSRPTDAGGSRPTDAGGSRPTDAGGGWPTDAGGSQPRDAGGSRPPIAGGSGTRKRMSPPPVQEKGPARKTTKRPRPPSPSPSPSPTPNPVRKKPRKSSGVKALQQIRDLQRSTNLLVPKLEFSRLVREVATEVGGPGLKFQSVAIMALQEAAEAFLVTLFEVSGRKCVMRGDVSPTVSYTEDSVVTRFISLYECLYTSCYLDKTVARYTGFVLAHVETICTMTSLVFLYFRINFS